MDSSKVFVLNKKKSIISSIVTKGQCADPSNGTGVYYFGHVMKLTDFTCEPGFEPVGPALIQCIQGDSSHDLKWSDLPTCKGNSNFQAHFPHILPYFLCKFHEWNLTYSSVMTLFTHNARFGISWLELIMLCIINNIIG